MTEFRKKLREILKKDYDSTDLFEAIDELHNYKIDEKDREIKELKGLIQVSEDKYREVLTENALLKTNIS